MWPRSSAALAGRHAASCLKCELTIVIIPITDSLSLDEREIEERFVRSSGPGGQNVNKVATAVQLRLDIPASSLPDSIKDRLAQIAGSRMTDAGVLVIDAREHRTQAQNRSAARERLAALIKRAASPPKRRRPTRPGKAAKEQRLSSKKHRAETKARRQRPI
jgi:ribosome-associated protein